MLRFAVPAGLAVPRRPRSPATTWPATTNATLDQQRTTATIVLLSLGLLILMKLATPMTKWRSADQVDGRRVRRVLAWPFPGTSTPSRCRGRPRSSRAVGIVALAWWVMEMASRLTQLYRRPYERLTAAQDARSAREAAARATRNAEGNRTIDLDPPITRAYPPVASDDPDPTRQRAPDRGPTGSPRANSFTPAHDRGRTGLIRHRTGTIRGFSSLGTSATRL